MVIKKNAIIWVEELMENARQDTQIKSHTFLCHHYVTIAFVKKQLRQDVVDNGKRKLVLCEEMIFSVDKGQRNFSHPLVLASVEKAMNVLWVFYLLLFIIINLFIMDFGIHQHFSGINIFLLCCQRLITFSHLSKHNCLVLFIY